MATIQQPVVERSGDARGGRSAALDLAGGAALALAAVAASWWLLALPASYAALGGALGSGLVALVAWRLPRPAPGAGAVPRAGIGPANRVTLGRAALAVPVLALACHPGVAVAGTLAWWAIGLSALVLALDGVDGRVARRTGTASAFGARFDMELDAALILALSVLVWRVGAVGAWVLAIGLMRYAFVAAGLVVPALARELPPSLRRKVVCVVQGVVLLVALAPVTAPAAAVAVSAAGLGSLAYSFVVDVLWALRPPASNGTGETWP